MCCSYATCCLRRSSGTRRVDGVRARGFPTRRRPPRRRDEPGPTNGPRHHGRRPRGLRRVSAQLTQQRSVSCAVPQCMGRATAAPPRRAGGPHSLLRRRLRGRLASRARPTGCVCSVGSAAAAPRPCWAALELRRPPRNVAKAVVSWVARPMRKSSAGVTADDACADGQWMRARGTSITRSNTSPWTFWCELRGAPESMR